MTGPVVDLHTHSTASDGEATPEALIDQAARVGLGAVAVTDHDTVAGVAEALKAGERQGVRVIAGCEFSVAVWWGELHLLAYFLPIDHTGLLDFLTQQRQARDTRAQAIVARLVDLGAPVDFSDVRRVADGAPIGRPHIARALVTTGAVSSLPEAFDRYLADGGPAALPRPLAPAEEVTALIRECGGVSSAAHLKERATRANVARLVDLGIDAVEVLHPAHDPRISHGLDQLADELGLLRTGGSDWHGRANSSRHQALGAMRVPAAWLDSLEDLHRSRRAALPS